MSWREVLELLEQVEGNMDAILPERIQAATGRGDGSPAIQKKIAMIEYRRRHKKRKEPENEKIKETAGGDRGDDRSLF